MARGRTARGRMARGRMARGRMAHACVGSRWLRRAQLPLVVWRGRGCERARARGEGGEGGEGGEDGMIT
eukprot:1584413-Prymnesium_polylepis.1